MTTGKNEYHIISKAIEQWEQEGAITKEEADKLRQNISLKETENQQIAQYFFLVAISCAILAFGAIFIDDKILEKLKVYFALSNLFIAAVSIALSCAWFWYVLKIRYKTSHGRYEVYMGFGTVLSLISLVYLFKDLGAGPYYHKLLLAATAMMLCISIISKSKVIWVGSLMAFTMWFGAFSTWLNVGYLFLGMNYPVRMTMLGLVIVLLSLLTDKIRPLKGFKRITFLFGILLFFASLWAVSVFGNYGHLDEWMQVRQSQVIFYALVFGACSVIAFYIGIKNEDDSLRDIAVFTILLNLYTRYFEYFWDSTNKGVFFLILAVSFYIVGKFLDKKRKKGSIKPG